jgi:flavin reductase
LIDGALFKAGMRRLPAAVTLVSCRHHDIYYGLTATAVCSLSAEPASLLACVNREASAHNAIVETRAFCINVLPHGKIALARLFASAKPEDRARRFATERWVERVTGAPVLDEAIVAFDCTLDQAIVYSSHSILIGQVQDIKLGSAAKHLMYVEGDYADFRTGNLREIDP